jgi:hypothetical protein
MRVTSMITYFARHAKQMRALTDIWRQEKPSIVRGLVVGPGLERGLAGIIGSYQPLELVNAILQAGIEDYWIDVLDTIETALYGYTHLSEGAELIIEQELHKATFAVDDDFDAYLASFLPDLERTIRKSKFPTVRKGEVVDAEEHIHSIRIPPEVMARFGTVQGHIQTVDPSNAPYDVVICTNVIGYYTLERKKLEERIRSWIIDDGLLLTDYSSQSDTVIMEAIKGKVGVYRITSPPAQ